jgi:protein TonB
MNDKMSGNNLHKKQGLFFNVGLVLSLAIVVTAFEWKTISRPSVVDLAPPMIEDELIDIKPTEIKPPEPPKPKVENFKLIEAPKDEPIEDISFSIPDPLDDYSGPDIKFEPPPKDEKVETVVIAEHMPSFGKEGQIGFLKYVQENLRYPKLARKHNVEGKVFVQFVVDTDGKMRDIKILKGIGYGCDQEVVRLIEEAPEWEPGKQRGNPVRVRMVLPIQFKLQ